MQWSRVTSDIANFNPVGTCPAERTNAIHWRDITVAGRPAETRVCTAPSTSPTRYWSANLIYDSAGYNWWTATTTVPGTHLDVWSVASHEIGHMTGFRFGGPTNNPGHWPESDATLCGDPGSATYNDRESMCEAIFRGTRIQRTPAAHDGHTFDGAY